jgi:hypothetical protein
MNRLLLVSEAIVESVTLIPLDEIIFSVKREIEMEWLPVLQQTLPVIRQDSLYQITHDHHSLDIAILSCSPVQHGIITENTRIIVSNVWPDHFDSPIVPWNEAVNEVLNEPLMEIQPLEYTQEPDKLLCKVKALVSPPSIQLPDNADESSILLLDASLLLHLGLGSGSQVIATFQGRKRAAWAFGIDQRG